VKSHPIIVDPEFRALVPAMSADSLAQLVQQRMNRRNSWVRRRRAYKALSFDGLDSGQMATGVPRLGELNLKKFSKMKGVTI